MMDARGFETVDDIPLRNLTDREQGRPFTPTGLAADRVLQFTTKAYPDHAGITPFLAILRELARTGEAGGQTLIFSNKTPAGVICEKELRHVLGGTLHPDLYQRRAFLEETISDFKQHFLCLRPAPFHGGGQRRAGGPGCQIGKPGV